MVERRRKPLILCSTKHIINSTAPIFHHQSSPTFRIPVGILRFPNLPNPNPNPNTNPSLDHSALIALSTRLLKTRSIASGSPVLIKNVDTNTQKIAVAVALDPPCPTNTTNIDLDAPSSSSSSPIMLVFPSCDFPLSGGSVLDDQVAYVCPLLAFNLNLHVACLKSILFHGQDALASYFKPQGKRGDEDATN